MANARDLKKFVREAAQRKKLEEARRERAERFDSIDEARQKKSEMEETLNQHHRDFRPFLSWFCGILFLFGLSYLAVLSYKSFSFDEQEVWGRPEINTDDLIDVEEYVAKLIYLSEKSNIAKKDFANGIPPYWLEKSQRILREMAEGKGRIDYAEHDEKQTGKEAHFIVHCSSDAGKAQIHVVRQNEQLKLMKVNKSW